MSASFTASDWTQASRATRHALAFAEVLVRLARMPDDETVTTVASLHEACERARPLLDRCRMGAGSLHAEALRWSHDVLLRLSSWLWQRGYVDPAAEDDSPLRPPEGLPLAEWTSKALDGVEIDEKLQDRVYAEWRERLEHLEQTEREGKGQPQYVNLDQIAARVNRSKSTLERLKRRRGNPLPDPDIPGGGGKRDEWLWSHIRPWLEHEFKRKLPELFPTLR
jgi:hypothetical protein